MSARVALSTPDPAHATPTAVSHASPATQHSRSMPQTDKPTITLLDERGSILRPCLDVESQIVPIAWPTVWYKVLSYLMYYSGIYDGP
jgi:hypothetical protein